MLSGADSPRQGRRGSLGTWPTPAPGAPGLRGLQRASGGFCLGVGEGRRQSPKGTWHGAPKPACGFRLSGAAQDQVSNAPPPFLFLALSLGVLRLGQVSN